MSFLQKKIFDVFPSSFGLDLSDLSIKVLRMESEGATHRVSGFASAALPVGSVIDGEILKASVVVDVIRGLLQEPSMQKMRTHRVVCSLPETKAFLRVISLPKMDEKEVSEAIRWEIEANIPLTLDQVYYDWQILGEALPIEKGKMNVLFVAVARGVVDQFVGALESAGLDVVGLETESIAQARSLLSESDEHKTTLTVDIGDRRTSFLISVGNIPCFTSSVPLSSQMITDAISKHLRISFQEAEDIKLKQGLGSLALHGPTFTAALPVLESIASEIEKSIGFYLGNLHYSNDIDTVILCGGGANMKGLLPYFSRRLGRDVAFGNPWVNVHLGNRLPPIDRNHAVQYSTAIGLALRGIDEYENIT